MSKCPQFINQHAGVDLYQDLEYILKDITNDVDPLVLKKSEEEKEAIIKLCLITISQIYQEYNETHIRTFIKNILDHLVDTRQPKKLKIKLTSQKVKQLSADVIQNVESLQAEKLASAQESQQTSAHESPKALAQESPKALAQESPKISAQESPKTPAQERPKTPAQESPEARAQGSPNFTPLIKKKKSPLQSEKKTISLLSTSEIELNLAKIEKFKKLPNYKQKSKEWLDQRSNYLTASTIAQALGLMGPVARRNLLINKVSYGSVNGFTGNPATHWGNKYEPVANGIYSYRNNGIKIYEFGMITNDKYPILGISPDGVTQYKMLEIKCPFSRVIDGKIKTEYYHQMQEQLSVCEFNECDFLECRFEEISEDRFWDDFYYYDSEENKNREKGIIISYLDLNEVNSNDFSVEYLYSPIGYYKNIDQMREWREQSITNLMRNPKTLYLGESYWQLSTLSCQVVKRDPQWIIDNYPILEAFWHEVEYYRKLGIDKLLDKIKKDTEITHSIDQHDEFEDDLRDIAKYYEKKTTKTQKKIIEETKIKTTNRKVKNVNTGHCLL